MIDSAAHWRDSGRRPRFFIVDANFIFPLIIFFSNITYKTLYFIIVMFVVFIILDRTQFTIKKSIRYLRVLIAGNQRYRKGWWQ